MKKASDYNWIALNDIEQNSWDSLRFKGKFCCLKKKSKIIEKKCHPNKRYDLILMYLRWNGLKLSQKI